MGWGINLNAEGKDSEAKAAEIKRVAKASSEWANKVASEAMDVGATSAMLTKEAKIQELLDRAPYLGISASLMEFIQKDLPDVSKQMQKEEGATKDKTDQLELEALSFVVSEMFKRADELKRM